MFRPSVIRALLTRYVLLYAKNPMRAFELFFWPLVQLLVWGFVTMFLQQAGNGGQVAASGAKNFPHYITFLIGGIILFGASGLLLGPLIVMLTIFFLEIWRVPVSGKER